MNYTYLAVAIGLYAASLIPYFTAGFVTKPIKAFLLCLDGFLTLAAFIVLIASFDNIWLGLLVGLITYLTNSHIGELIDEAYGYDPYEINATIKKMKAEKKNG